MDTFHAVDGKNNNNNNNKNTRFPQFELQYRAVYIKRCVAIFHKCFFVRVAYK